MSIESYQTVAEALRSLRRQGIRTRLHFRNDALTTLRARRRYTTDDCLLLKYFRIPPNNIPQETTTIYTVLLPDGRTAFVMADVQRDNAFELAIFMDKMNVATRAAS